MSQLTYNDITLDLIKTNSVDRSVKLSDDGTEYVHTEWTISINAVYSPSILATGYSAGPTRGPDNLPMITDQVIRHYLMQPRRSLNYQDGGIDIINIPVNLEDGGAIDAFNGPTPQSCTISRIVGSRIFYISYVIKCFVVECPPETDCPELNQICCALASSRYSRTEMIDEQYRTTMITSGIAYFRSDILQAFRQSADVARGFLIPPQLRGFKRKNIQFMLASNGMVIEWTCYDVESFLDLGALGYAGTAGSVGITDMDLKYTCQPLIGGAGPVKVAGYGANVNVTASAKGMRGANTLDMTYFLIAICMQKLGSIFPGGIGQPVNSMPGGTKIIEDVFRKEVTVSMDYQCTLSPQVGGNALSGVPILGWIGSSFFGPIMTNLPPLDGLNPTPPFSNGTRGTLPYQLAVESFADACYCSLSPIDRDPTGQITAPDLYTPASPYGNIPSVQGLQPGPQPLPNPYYLQPGIAPPQSLGNPSATGYLEYRIDDDIETDTGLIQVPLSGPPPTSGGSSSDSSGLPPPNDPKWYNTKSSVLLRVRNPMSRKKVSWAVTSVGKIPEAPDPVPDPESSLDKYYTLIKREVSPKAIELDTSGSIPVYRLEGVYWYAVRDSVPNQAYLPFPMPPFNGIEKGVWTEMEPDDFYQGIINYPSTNEGNTGSQNPM